MEKTFEYFKELRANDSITLDNIGDCCIKAFNDGGFVFYLMTKTSMGFSKVYQYGPLDSDMNICNGYSCSFQQIEYSEKVLSKIIDNFLNDKYRKITQVFECDEQEFIGNCKNIV